MYLEVTKSTSSQKEEHASKVAQNTCEYRHTLYLCAMGDQLSMK